MSHAHLARGRRPLRHWLRELELSPAPGHLQRFDLFLQHRYKLRVQRSELRRGRWQLHSFMFQPYGLLRLLRQLVQRGLHGQLGLHDQGWPQRQRIVQRNVHVSYHLHGFLLGELQQRYVRPPVRGRRRGSGDPERRQLSVTSRVGAFSATTFPTN
jgi:hypothetical protein